MTLQELLRFRDAIRSTSRRTEKIQIFGELFRLLRDDEVEIALALFTGTLPFGKLGIGPATLRQALALSHSKGTHSVSLQDLWQSLHPLSQIEGPGSQERRIQHLTEIFRRLALEEAQWLAEVLLGEVHQGAGERLILEAIGKTYGIPESDLKQAYLFGLPLSEILLQARKGHVKAEPRIFTPVRPMLAHPAEGVEEALDEMGSRKVRWEYKLDGARFQVHKDGREVRVFSRHLREITHSVPELVELVRSFGPDRLILEGELVALNDQGRPLPFQHFMRRFGRKIGIDRARKLQPLTPFFFDVLYADTATTSYPLEERLKILGEIVPAQFRIPALLSETSSEIQTFFQQAIEWGAEGLMAKRLDAPYVAGERVGLWLKIKPYFLIDCLIVAAEWGHGRRRGWLSNYHLAVWNEDRSQLLPVGKTFKGLTDQQFEWITQRLLALKIDEFPGGIRVRPEIVVEVAFSEVQESPTYPSGYALRFARIKRIRTDKSPQEANTLEDLDRLFQLQHARTPKDSPPQ